MQIEITTRHGNISDATREKIVGKVERLNRYFERLTAIEVTVDLDHRLACLIDIRVSAEHKHDFRATAEDENLVAALDVAVEKMEQQLRKYKEKVQEHHRASAEPEVTSETGTEAP